MSWSANELETRVAIKDGARTIAYVQVGAEEYANLIAAAPSMLDALRLADAAYAGQKDHGGIDKQSMAMRAIRAAIVEASRE